MRDRNTMILGMLMGFFFGLPPGYSHLFPLIHGIVITLVVAIIILIPPAFVVTRRHGKISWKFLLVISIGAVLGFVSAHLIKTGGVVSGLRPASLWISFTFSFGTV